MLWTEKTNRALLKAAQLHDGQYRKNGDGIDPYILHPIQVADIVSRHTDDEDVVCAALLHDTLEDTSYTREMLASEFGESVAAIVESVSIPEAMGAKRDWNGDRRAYIENLAGSTVEGAMIAAADKIHNFRSIVRDYSSDPSASMLHFKGSVDERLSVYGAVVAAIIERVPSDLREELQHAWNAYTVFLESVRAS